MSATARPSAEPRPLPSVAATLSIQEAVAVVWKRRWSVLLAAILPPLAALALILLLTPKYRAMSDILVKTGPEYLAPADPATSGMTAPTSTKQEGINSEVTLLTSRAVIEKTIDDIGLDTIYPGLAEDPPWFTPPMDAAIERFGRDLVAEPVKLSNIIAVQFDSTGPALAQRILDQHIRNYIAKHTEVFAGDRAESFQASINQALAELGSLEERRSRIKLDSGIYDIAAQRSALIAQRVDAEARLRDAQNRQATLQNRLAFLVATRPAIAETTQASTTEHSAEAVHARETLADLRQTEAAMAARYGELNPDLQRIRTQIAAAQRILAGTAGSRTSTSSAPSPLRQQVEQEIVMGNAELAPLPGEITRFEALIARINGELRRLEEADLALRNAVSRIDALTDNLKAMQGRYEQARTQEQTELAHQASVVQVAKAVAPSRPAKPRKSLFLAGGGLAGLLLAGMVVALSLLLNKTLMTPDAAERLLGLPVLAAIPILPDLR